MEKPYIKDLAALRFVVQLADWVDGLVYRATLATTLLGVPDELVQSTDTIRELNCGTVVSLRRWSGDFDSFSEHRNVWLSFNTSNDFVVRLHYSNDKVTNLSILNPKGKEVFKYNW